METAKKSPQIFSCKQCNFFTSKKSNYSNHLLTRKHFLETNGNKKQPDCELLHYCEDCGKSYKTRSGLWKHKQKGCKKEILKENESKVTNESDNELTNKDNIIVNLLKKMDEKDKQIMELIPKVGNNNTTNNNNQFNLQVFLNEDCKDAINWTEFIDSITLNLACLKELKSSNISESISDLICNKISELGIYKRPIHCVDQKRKKLCIKNEKDWENEEERVNALITKGDRKIQHEYAKLISKWEKDNPYWADSISEEEFVELTNKVYENIDECRTRSELIKAGTIPKINN